MTEPLNEWQVRLEEDLNATADQDLGTAVAVCDGEGRYDDGSLLEVCELHYDVDSDTWTPQVVTASLLVDPLLLHAVTDPATETLHTTVQHLHPDITISVRVQPKRVPPGWRQGRIEARLSDVGPNNQATYRTLPDDHPRKDGLRFHNASELRMYEALVRAQQRRPHEATIGVLPGAGFRTSQRTFWPDFVITHRGRVAVIEVDGPQHRNRAAADQSRDRQLQDAGVTLTERIVVEDVDQPAELDAFVERVLARLLTR
jgi:very-short-patch-repair endonuclease